MTNRKTVAVRIATTHPVPAYGGKQLTLGALGQLAEAVRSGGVPMVLHHNRMNDLHARVLNVEIVELEDGHRAVEAMMEVDADPWDEWQSQLDELGVPGGMSYSGTEPIGELPAREADAAGKFGVFADAGYFSDEEIIAAASELTSVGAVRTGRLYQFSAVQTCRIIVEYVHSTGGLDAAAVSMQVGISLASSAIYDCIKYLLARRPALPRFSRPPNAPAPDTANVEPAQIEIQTTTEPGGVTTQTLQIRTNDASVLWHALDRITEAMMHPERPVLEWDEERGTWREP